jgi:hypothetical protein
MQTPIVLAQEAITAEACRQVGASVGNRCLDLGSGRHTASDPLGRLRILGVQEVDQHGVQARVEAVAAVRSDR